MLAITVNGHHLNVKTNTTLQQALALYTANTTPLDLSNVAVVVNQNIVPRSLWQEHVCQSHDHIEIFSPVAGG